MLGNYNGKQSPIRKRGCIILLKISYANTNGYGVTDPFYTTSLEYMPDADYKIIEPLPTKVEDMRILRKRFGIQIKIVQTGKIARVSIANILLNIASGLSLLGLATKVVEYIALYCLPKKEEYSDMLYKNEVSDSEEKEKIE